MSQCSMKSYSKFKGGKSELVKRETSGITRHDLNSVQGGTEEFSDKVNSTCDSRKDITAGAKYCWHWKVSSSTKPYRREMRTLLCAAS